MDQLTSPHGSVALAVAALLLVLGFRIVRPKRAREWVALVACALAIVTQVLGAQEVLPGAVHPAGVVLRGTGAGLLVVGLVFAARSARTQPRTATESVTHLDAVARSLDSVYAGLALVVFGQLLRGPSVAGGVAGIGAIAINLWVALKIRRR